MKKRSIIILSSLLVILGIAAMLLYQKTARGSVPVQETAAVVSVTIDDGEHIATSSGITANNPFDALITVSKTKELSVTTKQYDFGQFVQAIGDKNSSETEAWIYFVNGTSGSIAADKYLLHTGDMVEWKYTAPQW